MLNKKCLFGGGLYLVNIIAIFASTSNNVIARTSIHNFRSELNQIDWEVNCSWREYNIRYYKYDKAYDGDDKYSWILNEYYEESRTRVIGKAIGDCVADEGYFEHKKADDILTFKNTLPEWYERKNWNAVILYNYVHEVINGNNLPEDSTVNQVLKNKLNGIKTHYENYYREYIKRKHIKKDDADKLIDSLQKNLDDAVNDIQKYVDALKLHESLLKYRWEKPAYKKKQSIEYLAPNLETSPGGECAFYRGIMLTDKKNPDIFYVFTPTIACYNNQLYIVGLSYNWNRWEDFEQEKQFISGSVNDIKNLIDLKQVSTRLLERLGGLVKLPDENLLQYWLKQEAKAKQKQLAQYYKTPENFDNQNMMYVIEEEKEEQEVYDGENEYKNEQIAKINPEDENEEEMINYEEGLNEENNNMEEQLIDYDEYENEEMINNEEDNNMEEEEIVEINPDNEYENEEEFNDGEDNNMEEGLEEIEEMDEELEEFNGEDNMEEQLIDYDELDKVM